MTTVLSGHADTSSSPFSLPTTSAFAVREACPASSVLPALHQSALKIYPPPNVAGEMPPPATIPKKRKAPDAPSRVKYIEQSSASPSAASGDGDAEDDQDDGEYDPASTAKRVTATANSATGSKRTRAQPNAVAGPSSTSAGGRQAGAVSGSDHPTSGKGRQLSREQLRKANHSLIEKRRREKINAALQALRDMVPSLNGPDTSGKAGEFKLEVLERTVEHMRELKQYIINLEAQLAATSSGQPGRQAASLRQATVVNRHEASSIKAKTSKQRQSTSSPPTPSSSPDSASEDEEDEDDDENGGYAGDRSQYQARTPNHAGRMRGGAMDDPDETEPEAFLPPAGAVARQRRRSRSDRNSPSDSTTSTGSLLGPLASQAALPPFFTTGFARSAHESSAASASGSRACVAHSARPDSPSLTYPASLAAQAVPSSRPAAPPQAHNPTLYLPFPTPSPTSPFLTYSTTASSSSGPPEPSPFLAPLQNINMSLFGGAINLDQPIGGTAIHGIDTPSLTGKRSHSEETQKSDGAHVKADADSHYGGVSSADSKRRSKQHMAPEEVANLLLAISSPDTLRPSNGQTMLTPKMIPIGGPEDLASLAGSATARESIKRRSTLEGEDFRLDAVPSARPVEVIARTPGRSASSLVPSQGKTASDILDL